MDRRASRLDVGFAGRQHVADPLAVAAVGERDDVRAGYPRGMTFDGCDTGICGADVPPLIGSVLTGTGLTVAQAIAAIERGERPALSDVQRRIVDAAALEPR